MLILANDLLCQCKYPDYWSIIKDMPNNINWCKGMGNSPILIDCRTYNFCRLACIKDDNSLGFKTTGVWSKDKLLFEDGKLRIVAKFKGGKSSWPAIWLKNANATNKNNYYEIDICEYFEKRKRCKTGLFMPKHLNWGLKRLFRPKKYPKIKKDDWNVFECDWDENRIIITINGKKVLEYKNKGKSDQYPQTAKDRKFYLILSMQYDKKDILMHKKDLNELPLYMDIQHIEYYPKDIDNLKYKSFIDYFE